MRELVCREELTLTLSHETRVTLKGSLSVRVLHDSLGRAPIDIKQLWSADCYKHNPQLRWEQGALSPIEEKHAFPTRESKEVLRWCMPRLDVTEVPYLSVNRTPSHLQLQARQTMRQFRVVAAYGLILHEQAVFEAFAPHNVALVALCEDDFPLRCEMLCADQEPLGVQAVCSESVLRIVIIVP